MRKSEHHLFYAQNAAGETVVLDETETRHAVSVLRLQSGEDLLVSDGGGNVFECRYDTTENKKAQCRVVNRRFVSRTEPRVTLLIGLPDKEAFETVLEHATALGTYRIVPLVMEHCRKPWWKSWEKAQQRFFQKMIVSMKQCLYPYLPRLESPQDFSEAVRKCTGPIIAADQDGDRFTTEGVLSSTGEMTGVIGPPGGYSEAEMEMLLEMGARRVNISPNRLRTELAATVLVGGMIMSAPEIRH
ncbi:MAG: RsmE family RNA methyltransferase [Chitinispirillaceae bacterium]